MSSVALSPTAKAATGVVVALVQIGLLAVLGMTAVQSADEVGGEAPVIELTLSPRIAFDSVNGAEEAVAAPKTSTPLPVKDIATKVSPDAAAPVAIREARFVSQAELINVTAPPVRPPSAGMSGSDNPTAPAPTAAGTQNSRRGMTNGGAGRVAGASAGAQTDDYDVEVLRWVETHKRHPGGVAGVVTVAFTLDRRGRMRDERILASSGTPTLDAATLRQLKSAQPFPRPPSNVTWRTRDFRVRLDYRPRGS